MCRYIVGACAIIAGLGQLKLPRLVLHYTALGCRELSEYVLRGASGYIILINCTGCPDNNRMGH